MIPEEFQDLLLEKHLAHLSTKNPDGTLQISPVWIDYDPETGHVLFNTAKGRKKDRNLDVGAPVAVSVSDTNDFYRYIAIQGEIVEKTEEGANAHIDKLAKKYFGREKYGGPEGEVRLKLAIKPNHVKTSGK